jgi:hypothetical protein
MLIKGEMPDKITYLYIISHFEKIYLKIAYFSNKKSQNPNKLKLFQSTNNT